MTENSEITDHSNDKELVQEISNLHYDIRHQAEAMLPKIMRIGELLVKKKQKIPHGQFTRWVSDNLPFTTRTAQNYMKVFKNKKMIENEKVSVLSDAYNILKLPRDPLKETGDEDEKKYFITISVDEAYKGLFKDVLDIAKEVFETNSNSIAIMSIMYNWGISEAPELCSELEKEYAKMQHLLPSE